MPAKKHLTLKLFIFLISTDILETFAQFCFKKSAVYHNTIVINTFFGIIFFIKDIISCPFLWMALLSVLCIFVMWATILSKIDLSVAVPVCSFSYITVPLVSAVFLHEKISALRCFGIAFILMGVILVSLSTRHKEKLI